MASLLASDPSVGLVAVVAASGDLQTAVCLLLHHQLGVPSAVYGHSAAVALGEIDVAQDLAVRGLRQWFFEIRQLYVEQIEGQSGVLTIQTLLYLRAKRYIAFLHFEGTTSFRLTRVINRLSNSYLYSWVHGISYLNISTFNGGDSLLML